MKRLNFLLLLILFSCADVTPGGKKIHLIETEGGLLEAQNTADEFAKKHDCEFIGFVDAKSAHFPPAYSVHENEIHAALRNRASKMGVNVVVANFYKKPAQGVGLLCPEESIKE